MRHFTTLLIIVFCSLGYAQDCSILGNSSVCETAMSATYRSTNNIQPADNTDFRGCSHYNGLDLTINGLNTLGNGRLIGVKPIELDITYQRTQNDYQARTLRTYANVERTATIKNGEVFLSA